MENRPGALELTHMERLRGLQADGEVGWRQDSIGKSLPTLAVQENHTEALKSTAPPLDADASADSVALGWDLGIRIFKSLHIIQMNRQG